MPRRRPDAREAAIRAPRPPADHSQDTAGAAAPGTVWRRSHRPDGRQVWMVSDDPPGGGGAVRLALALTAARAAATDELIVPAVELGDGVALVEWYTPDGTCLTEASALALVEHLVRSACRTGALIELRSPRGCVTGRPLIEDVAIAAELTVGDMAALTQAIAGVARCDAALAATGLTGTPDAATATRIDGLLDPWADVPFHQWPLAALLAHVAEQAHSPTAELLSRFARLLADRQTMVRHLAPDAPTLPAPRRLAQLLSADVCGAPDRYIP